MKINLLIIASIASIAALGITGCNHSSKEKMADAKANLADAKQDLNQARADSIDEYAQYKANVEIKFKENDRQIALLKAKIKTEKQSVNTEYQKELNMLEAKNTKLKAAIQEYKEVSVDKWHEFKTGFNKDMNELGESISALAKKNMQ